MKSFEKFKDMLAEGKKFPNQPKEFDSREAFKKWFDAIPQKDWDLEFTDDISDKNTGEVYAERSQTKRKIMKAKGSNGSKKGDTLQDIKDRAADKHYDIQYEKEKRDKLASRYDADDFEEHFQWMEQSIEDAMELTAKEVKEYEDGDYDVTSHVIPYDIRRSDGEKLTPNDLKAIALFVKDWENEHDMHNMKLRVVPSGDKKTAHTEVMFA